MHSTILTQYRCTCGRLLFKGIVRSGHVEIKCKRCCELVRFAPPQPLDGSMYQLLVDEYGTILDASKSIHTVLGYTSNELISMNLCDLLPYSSSPYAALSVLEAVYPQTHVTKSGVSLPISVRRERVGLALREELYTCTVTEPLALNDRIRVPGLEHLEGYVHVDTDMRCTSVSSEIVALTGISYDMLIGSYAFSLFALADRERLEAWLAQIPEREHPFSLKDMRLARAPDTIFVMFGVPTWHDDGRLRGHVLLFTQAHAA